VSELQTCGFAGEIFQYFEVLQFSIIAMTTQLLSSGEFCKLRYDTIPFKSASARVSFYRGADKSLARPGRKQAAPVKSVMGRGMD
jgi:hypothetical protein